MEIIELKVQCSMIRHMHKKAKTQERIFFFPFHVHTSRVLALLTYMPLHKRIAKPSVKRAQEYAQEPTVHFTAPLQHTVCVHICFLFLSLLQNYKCIHHTLMLEVTTLIPILRI